LRVARSAYGKDVFLDGQLDGGRIHAGHVEMNLELVAPTARVHGNLPDSFA
jgi:hypothetical protein